MKCNIRIYLWEVVGSVLPQNTSLVRVVVLAALQKSLFVLYILHQDVFVVLFYTTYLLEML